MTSEQRRYWDQAAGTFDHEPDHGLLDPATRHAWRDLLLGMLSSPPASVLDVGCGTGTLSVLLAAEGYRVQGIDLSPAMLDRARSKAAAAGLTVTFAEGDAAGPEVEPSSFDIVLCRHVLWALPDPTEAVANWRKALRVGGQIVAIEGTWDTGSGLASDDAIELLRRHTSTIAVIPLSDPVLWGGTITDSRYAVVATL